MAIPYAERARKLRIITVVLGYLHPLDLLNDYHDKDDVPGICTSIACNFVTSVGRMEEYGHCDNCDTFSVVSILVLAGVV